MGRATLATDVSSTSITVASITETAMSHGLKLGTHCCGASTSAIGLAEVASLPDLDARLSRHARSQQKLVRRILVKYDLYRHPLDDLDEITRRVLSRQQAEPRARSGLKALDLAAKRLLWDMRRP